MLRYIAIQLTEKLKLYGCDEVVTSPTCQPITGEYLCDGVAHHDVRFEHATNQLLQLR